ncbi:MAG: hypothetical protein IKJ14_04380 [Clostridia bacterium]|nr:hypothetical protein [Clostridia bacterium]
MLKERKSNLNSSIINSLKEFNENLNVNSIIGAPIKFNDYTVIPISKLTVGYIGGGGEYGEVKTFSSITSHPFAGGSGTIFNLVPCGFLICKKSGVSFVKTDDSMSEKIFEKATEFINENIKK